MERSEIRILILASNPKNTNRLRLDEEVREIKEGLLRSKYRENFSIYQAWAVRLRDIRRSMLDYEPHIVHFCGHGSESGLMMEGDNADAVIVRPDALEGLFELFNQQVECVLLNACYSQSQALAISKHIDCVIGMKSGIQDKAAIEFAVGFYDALGAGRSFEHAFKFGQNAIQLFNIPQELVPVLNLRSPASKLRPHATLDTSSRQDIVRDLIIERLLMTQFANVSLGSCQSFKNREYTGKSGNKYVVDASFEINAGGINLLVLAQCKVEPAPVIVDEVMSFSYQLRDIGAHKGLLITTWGFDKKAIEIARTEGIALLISARGRLEHYIGLEFTLYEHWISDITLNLTNDQSELQIVGLRRQAGNCFSFVERFHSESSTRRGTSDLAFLMPSEEGHLELSNKENHRLYHGMGRPIPLEPDRSYEQRPGEIIG